VRATRHFALKSVIFAVVSNNKELKNKVKSKGEEQKHHKIVKMQL